MLSINNDKPPGSDNLDGKLLRIIADDIATPICHIFNQSLLESVCPHEVKPVWLCMRMTQHYRSQLLPRVKSLEGASYSYKEIQLVSKWVARNKLVLNMSKTKIRNVEIEQVEVTKLLVNCHGQNILIQQ